MSRNAHLRNLYRPALLTLPIHRNELSTSCISNKNFLARSDSYGYKKPSIVENITDKVKFYFYKHKLLAAGYYMYERVADDVDYASFMKAFSMPDTFNSWFLITELHLWMVIARMMADPKSGRFIRNVIVEALWKDVITRTKKLESEHATVVKSQIMQMSEEFQAALVTYDEGILSDDTVLASAVWRRILSRQCDVRQLEAMVKYVRQTIFYLHKVSIEDMVYKKKIEWIPVNEVFKSLPP
ncbi:ubiquinol-cytochrome-c reductase complex assembly factor 1 isoform X2 [Halyomorpha halys]|nr:ubiquinol-cytochrome-c reductase complex assembly factor 1 isoform X2 [Halyomorpha halys]